MKHFISSVVARNHFADLLGKVAFAHDEFIITKQGKPVARLVSLEREGSGGISSQPSRLADVKGWLEDDDPYFRSVELARKISRNERVRNPFGND